MKINMGSSDRTIRSIVAVVLILLYLTNIISGTVAIVALIVSAIFLLTSIFSFCPLYTLLGVNTCGVKKNKA
jgi:hypothetical protein